MQSSTLKSTQLDFNKIAESMTASEVNPNHTIGGNNQTASFTNKLMMKLLPWCKLKRSKFVFRDALSCDDIASVFIRSRTDKSLSTNRLFINKKNTINKQSIYGKSGLTTLPLPPPPPPKASTGNDRLTSATRRHQTLQHYNHHHHHHQHPLAHHPHQVHYPMVSFINKGEGVVSMDTSLVDHHHSSSSSPPSTHPHHRVIVNDSDIYSMSIAKPSSLFSSSHSLSNVSSSIASSIKSNQTANNCPNDSMSSSTSSNTTDCDTNPLPPWFYGPICRDVAISLLSSQSIGCFLVRESTSKPGCYALSLRVPKHSQISGVAHYLILRTAQGTFKIKGFTKEFTNLQSLIVHHSIMQELLPVTLNLTCISRRDDVDISLNEKCTKFIEEPMAMNYDNNDEEELVDLDLDPDYNRILTSFRKSMANCK